MYATNVIMDAMPTQYADASGYVTAEADDAHSATVFTPGAEVIVNVVRTPRGRWAYDFSDYITPGAGLLRARFDTPAAAIRAVLTAGHVTLNVVDEG